MDIASLRAKLDNIAEELAQLPEQDTVAIEEEEIEEVEQPVEEDHNEKDEDGNVIPHDEIEEEAVEEGFAVGASVAPSEEGPDQAPGKVIAVDGDKVTVKFMDGSTEVFAQDELFALPAGLKVGEEVAEDEIEEGKMSDLHQHIGEMIADGASNEEIKKMHPMVKDSDIDSIRREMDESVQFEQVQEVDEVAESIAKMAAMAGVGSTAKSNHGIHEGEAGYQLTPRSIVAREMRKLQDIERGSK